MFEALFEQHFSRGSEAQRLARPGVQAPSDVVELTAENTDQVVLRVRDGTLLLFPSFLEHSVDANASDQERASVSFNVMFSEFAERMAKPLWGLT